MIRLLGKIAGVAQVVASLILVLIIIIVAMLLVSGRLNQNSVSLMVKILEGEDVSREKIIEKPILSEWLKLEEARKKQEETLKKKEEQVKALMNIHMIRQMEIEKKIEKSDKEMKELFDARAMLEKEKKAFYDIKERYDKQLSDERFLSNIKMFEKMDAIDVVNILKNMPEEEIALYMRKLKPAMAAEILNLFAQDTDLKVKAKVDKILKLPSGNPN